MTTSFDEQIPTMDTTGARPLRSVLIIGTFAFATVLGTSASGSGGARSPIADPLRTTTHAGTSIENERLTIIPRQETNAVLREIRSITGYTWQQLSHLLGVDRRSLHLWVSGGGIRPEHERQLVELRELVRDVNAGSPSATRAELTSSLYRGRTIGESLATPRLALVETAAVRAPSRAFRARERDFDLEHVINKPHVPIAHTPGRGVRAERRPRSRA